MPKYNKLTRKINQAEGERAMYSANVEIQQYISQRMREIRACIVEADMLDKFDRVVFESIVDKVIVGDISEEGSIDSYKFTFALKGKVQKHIFRGIMKLQLSITESLRQWDVYIAFLIWDIAILVCTLLL